MCPKKVKSKQQNIVMYLQKMIKVLLCSWLEMFICWIYRILILIDIIDKLYCYFFNIALLERIRTIAAIDLFEQALIQNISTQEALFPLISPFELASVPNFEILIPQWLSKGFRICHHCIDDCYVSLSFFFGFQILELSPHHQFGWSNLETVLVFSVFFHNSL